MPIIKKSPGQSKSGRTKYQLVDESQVFVRSLRLRIGVTNCYLGMRLLEVVWMFFFNVDISIQLDSIAVILLGLCKKPKLVGGFNPFEKYACQIGSFPN